MTTQTACNYTVYAEDFASEIAMAFRSGGWEKASDLIDKEILAIPNDGSVSFQVFPVFNDEDSRSIADIMFSKAIGKLTVEARFTIDVMHSAGLVSTLDCRLVNRNTLGVLSTCKHQFSAGFGDIPELMNSVRYHLVKTLLHDIGMTNDASGSLASSVTLSGDNRLALVTMIDIEDLDNSISSNHVAAAFSGMVKKCCSTECGVEDPIFKSGDVIFSSVPVTHLSKNRKTPTPN